MAGKLLHREDAKKHFYITKTEEEYREYVKDVNTRAHTPFRVKPERIESNVELFCGKKFYCVDAYFKTNAKEINVIQIVNSNVILPRGVLSYKIPLDVALEQFPEYFI